MTKAEPQRDARRLRRMRAQLQACSIALLAMFLLDVPTIRTNELNEIASSKERVEDTLLVNRVVSARRMALHCHDKSIVLATSLQARVGHARRPEPALLDGHRLSNGLLAPMTC